ncbi:hypothetical protein UA08_09233 [Talaromyces atroroseus]|uniref:Alginate lyase 2 domain-containing protein n=1 Tax=Talaromyces atroroseus TaxID=1441469 RepID=A0A1Q5Q778_TALAT|nr:hypothetical protein UA08_09233 [Talaromyces atroroseus]OKL55541.1 hypothetical protein UA08_09233 [Talaromyces atroroseus]
MSPKQYLLAGALHVMTTWATCAPGYYMPILANFQLQLPYGTDDTPLYVSGSELSGCDGYQNSSWFYWNETSSHLVMNAPPSSTDCAKTPGSKHCRTELREEDPSSWSPSGTNTMTVTLSVPEADDGSHGTVIGQVFSAEYSKPVVELYYEQSGNIFMGVEQTTTGGDTDFTQVATVPEGTKFTYELSYSDYVLSFALNGGTPATFDTSQLGYPNGYFKVGDYNQGTNDYSKVDVYSITIVHE